MLEAEKSHASHLDMAQRHVKNVVADKDYAPGDLVIVERPFLTVPIAKFAGVVCHGCLNPLNKAGNGNAAAGNPCLPRYCQECKKLDHDIDTKLAALRIKLPGIATEHSLDPTMLHIVMLLDLQRCGFKVGMVPEALLASGKSDGENESRVQSTVADFDVLTNVWDRKTEAWRKKVGPAIRALHKELQALADGGCEYPSPGGYEDAPPGSRRRLVHLARPTAQGRIYISASRQCNGSSLGDYRLYVENDTIS